MKYKFKYMLALVIALFAGCNYAHADANEQVCHYKTDKFMAKLTVKTGYDVPGLHTFEQYTDITINRIGSSMIENAEDVNNWFGFGRDLTTVDNYRFKSLYSNSADANKNGKCPAYLVFQYCKAYKVWGTNDINEATTATNGISKHDDCMGYYAGHTNNDGSEISEEQYWAGFKNPEMGGEVVTVTCNMIFGNRKDKDSLAYMIDEVMGYVHIIVPILIILLGSIDFARAVVAGKEDEMKKAQTTFIKRLIAGVFVFLVPVLIDVIMWLADMVWTYGTPCQL